jgi:hypothetical protein
MIMLPIWQWFVGVLAVGILAQIATYAEDGSTSVAISPPLANTEQESTRNATAADTPANTPALRGDNHLNNQFNSLAEELLSESSAPVHTVTIPATTSKTRRLLSTTLVNNKASANTALPKGNPIPTAGKTGIRLSPAAISTPLIAITSPAATSAGVYAQPRSGYYPSAPKSLPIIRLAPTGHTPIGQTPIGQAPMTAQGLPQAAPPYAGTLLQGANPQGVQNAASLFTQPSTHEGNATGYSPLPPLGAASGLNNAQGAIAAVSLAGNAFGTGINPATGLPVNDLSVTMPAPVNATPVNTNPTPATMPPLLSVPSWLWSTMASGFVGIAALAAVATAWLMQRMVLQNRRLRAVKTQSGSPKTDSLIALPKRTPLEADNNTPTVADIEFHQVAKHHAYATVPYRHRMLSHRSPHSARPMFQPKPTTMNGVLDSWVSQVCQARYQQAV